MLRQLHLLTIPTAISIAFFDATYLVIANVFGFSGRDVVLGVVAAAGGGLCVFVSVLYDSARKSLGAVDATRVKLPIVHD